MAAVEADYDAAVDVLAGEAEAGACLDALSRVRPRIGVASAQNARLVQVLVQHTLPNLYPAVRGAEAGREVLHCLCTTAGVGALLEHLRASTLAGAWSMAEIYAQVLQDLLDLSGASMTQRIWLHSREPENRQKAQMLWNEYVNMMAGSRLLNELGRLSVGARAANYEFSWTFDAKALIGRVSEQVLGLAIEQDQLDAAAKMLERLLLSGYADVVVHTLAQSSCGDAAHTSALHAMVLRMRDSLQRVMARKVVQYADTFPPVAVPDVAAFLAAILPPFLLSRFIAAWEASVGLKLSTLQALASALFGRMACRGHANNHVAADSRELPTLIARLLSDWGSRKVVQGETVEAQETLTRLILCLVAYESSTDCQNIMSLPVLTNGISMRLAAVKDDTKCLALYVGEAISDKTLVPESKRLRFNVPQANSDKAREMKALAHAVFELGDPSKLADAQSIVARRPVSAIPTPADVAPRERAGGATVKSAKFTAYPLPDSDEEDSDDDPSLDHSKAKRTRPLYIRGLVSMLKEESYEAQKTALESAPELVLRKANYGTEVKEHLQELLDTLVNMQDNFDIPNFNELRHATMVQAATVLAEQAGPHLSRLVFSNTISQQQRLLLLSAIGVAARRLAGVEQNDIELRIPKALQGARLHSSFTDEIDMLAEQVKAAELLPIVEASKEETEGPKALHVKRFSRRPMVAALRAKPSANRLTTVARAAFVEPLVSGWWRTLRDSLGQSAIFEPLLIGYILKVLAVLTHLLTLLPPPNFSNLVSDVWSVALSMRGMGGSTAATAAGETGLEQRETIMFAFMTVIDALPAEDVASELSQQLVETHEYCVLMFDSSPESSQTHALAAAILLKTNEIMEKYRISVLENTLALGTGVARRLGAGRFGLAGLK